MWPIDEASPAPPAPPPAPVPVAPPEAAPPSRRAGIARSVAFGVAGVVVAAVAVRLFDRPDPPGEPHRLEGPVRVVPPAGTSTGAPPPAASAGRPASPSPVRPSPAPANPWAVAVRGVQAGDLVDALARLAREATPSIPAAAALRFAPDAGAEPAPDVTAIEASRAGVTLVSSPPSPVVDAERPDALVPLWLVGETLRGVRLPIRPDARPTAAFALSLLLVQDPGGAAAALRDAPDDVGLRILKAFAAVSTGAFAATHRHVKGLEDDPDVGFAARFLVGAALFGDGSTREALRDFEAARAARPTFWPATLFAAAANHRLGLREEALAGYDAVLEAVPGRPEALLGRAAALSATDPRAALDALTRLVRDHPDHATAWARIADLRSRGTSPQDLDAAAAAFARIAALRPRDAAAWSALAAAEWRRGVAGRGAEALRAAAEAYDREAALATGPAAAVATFNRGAVLHQWALLPPPDLVLAEARARLADARRAYEEALAATLPPEYAPRAHFNRGLAIDLLFDGGGAGGAGGGGGGGDAPPPEATKAFEAALAADAGYAPAGFALAAVRLASGDAAAASKALAGLPPGASPDSRELLAAAVDALAGRVDDVRAYLARTTPSFPAGADPVAALAGRLSDAAYARVARALVGPQPKEPARLAERVRASARLWDAATARADLERLERLDAPSAASLRSSDAVLRAVLGD
jgi:tetratricopeptide (TPR) repeat protein